MKVRAAQLVAPRKWQLIEEEKPEPKPGNMLVRIERVAICGSDKPSFCGFHDSYPLPVGVTGHEGLGVVEACPSGTYKEGERVLLSGFDRGLYQEYVLANDHGVVRLPQDFDAEVILMAQLLGTVIHSFYKMGNLINQRVVVIGQGAVGLLFDAVLRNLGARQIIGVDLLDYRLGLGRRMGATHTINPKKQSLVETVTQITEGELADVVVEAVGEEETLNQIHSLARRNASVICFGVPDKGSHDGRVSLQMMAMFRKELRLITSVGPEPWKDYTIARDWIVQERLDVRPIVSHVRPFETIQESFEMAFDYPEQDQVVKIVLKF
ncbi:MAG: zinc-binding dehydrogenase [Candidatus Latescibacteria bacterium]|nr:zinc-binding dehydrogenase [Candidatus Latescibacterota bacterium]